MKIPLIFAPPNEPGIVGDNAGLRLLGRRPEIPIEETLASIVNHSKGA